MTQKKGSGRFVLQKSIIHVTYKKLMKREKFLEMKYSVRSWEINNSLWSSHVNQGKHNQLLYTGWNSGQLFYDLHLESIKRILRISWYLCWHYMTYITVSTWKEIKLQTSEWPWRNNGTHWDNKYLREITYGTWIKFYSLKMWLTNWTFVGQYYLMGKYHPGLGLKTRVYCFMWNRPSH